MTANADKRNEIVRCTRVLEYVGPRWWVQATLKQNAVTIERPREFGNGRSVREVSITTEPVTDAGA